MPRPQGECPVCGNLKSLQSNGTMAAHSDGKRRANSWPPRNCEGRGLPPVGSPVEPRIA